METYDRLNEAYLKFLDELENNNYEVEQDVLDLEQEVNDALEYTSGEENLKLSELYKKINNLINEYDFFEEDYDEEAVLDMMFPDRYEQGFDEDSMSYDSVFGDD